MRSAYFAILPPHVRGSTGACYWTSSDLRLHDIKIAEQWLQFAIKIESVAAQTRSH
jgi:hypothetical protein